MKKDKGYTAQKITVKSLFSGKDGVGFIEFEEEGKSKILSIVNFRNRYGDWSKYK